MADGSLGAKLERQVLEAMARVEVKGAELREKGVAEKAGQILEDYATEVRKPL